MRATVAGREHEPGSHSSMNSTLILTAPILTVDPNKGRAQELKSVLGAQGCDVRSVCSVTEALGLLAAWRPGLILWDVQADGGDDPGWLLRVRGKPGLEGVPIVVIGDPVHCEKTLDVLLAGADGFIARPCSPPMLLARLGCVLARWTRSAGGVWEAGVESTLKGRKVFLTPHRAQAIESWLECGNTPAEAEARLGKTRNELRDIAAAASALSRFASASGTLAPPGSRRRDVTILIAEDSPTQAENLRLHLEEQGYQVVHAPNGRIALEATRAKHPDAILSDVLMPEMDGFDLCKAVRQDPVLSGLPFILLTTLSDPEEIIRGLMAGADYYLTKPYDPEYLLGKVSELLEWPAHRGAEHAEEPVEVVLGGQRQVVHTHQQRLVNLLLATYENAVQQNGELLRVQRELKAINEELEARVARRTATLEQEVRDRQQAEGALRVSHDFNEMLLQAMPFGIDIVDEQGRILFMSKAMRDLVGTSALGNPCWEIYRDDGSRCDGCPLARSLEVGQTASVEVQGMLGGKTILLNQVGILYQGRKAILEVFQDITEKKQLEAQFLRAQRLESVGSLAGGIAHDLNNILSPVLLAASMLREEGQSPRCLSMLDILQTSAQRGTEIVKQVLAFSRGIEGQKSLMNLRHLVLDMVKIVQATFPKSIRVRPGVSHGLWSIVGDATQMHQVLLNLAVNARDAMPEGGVLTLEAENITLDEASAQLMPGLLPGPHVVLTVSDTGTGIPPEIADKIFDPFFTTKTPDKGTGLGLSTVIGIIKGHRGFVTFHCPASGGTRFKVFLPATVNGEGIEEFEGQPAPRGAGERILVVDDEEPVRLLTTRLLEEHGYRTLVARDGNEAIQVYAENMSRIDMVITDMNMPNLGGEAAIAGLRGLDPEVKIIVVSGADQADAMIRDALLQVEARLEKPFKARVLLETIRSALLRPVSTP